MDSSAGYAPVVSPTRSASTSRRKHVLVLGGGLAGIAAALRLAEAGCRVTLLERRKLLGGRASSHVDPQSGQLLDNCQHVLLGCCTNLLDLYNRLGVSHLIEWHDALHFLDSRGHQNVLRRDHLPAPLHLAMSIARFHSLSWSEKLQITRAAIALLRITPEDYARWHNRLFVEWLAAHHQSPQVIHRFWNVIITSALNQSIEQANAAYAIQVLRQGFLNHRDAYRMGLASVPLSRLYEPAQRMIEDKGGRVLLGVSVARFLYDGQRLAGIETSHGDRIEADAYVSALPIQQLLRADPPELRQVDERFRRLHELQFSPILGVHLWFNSTVMTLPHAILLDSPLQWVFNRGVDAAGCQHLHVVISAAHDWMNQHSDQILSCVRDELAVYLPGVRSHDLALGKVIKERHATFAPLPGVDALRPDTSGVTDNLFFAGDFCQTGWPATMEGAVRSGYRAAAALLKRDGLLASDLPAALLVRCLRI